MKKSLIISSMAALAALCTCLTAQAQGPMVVSDKGDYSPGETALFSATGFQSGELLDFSIAIADDNGLWIPDVAWAEIPADASGAADIEYVVPETWLGKSLQLTTMGLTSGLMATTTFTDTVTTAVINSPTTGSPVTVTTDGAMITINVTYATTGPPPGDNKANVHFSLDGGANFAEFNGEPNSQTADYTVMLPSGLANGCHDLKLQVTRGGNGTDTETCAIIVNIPPPPPENQPPVITPMNGDVDLGQIVGCLDGNGGFGTSVSVVYSVSQVDANNFNVYATFNGGNQTLIATVNDPDGNLQAVNIVANPASDTLTFTGPGTDTQTYSTSVTATDDDNAFDTEACGGDATVQVTYNFNGFFSPLSMSATTKVKRGSGVPVKFSITDCDGAPITTGNHTIDVQYVSGIVPTGDPTVDDAGMSGDNGINFRYDPTGMQWIFNLKTNTTYGVGNTYKIVATLDDETTHEALISIK